MLPASQSPKPVIVMKAGKRPGGNRAVSSHTASLGGDYKVFSEVMSQYVIVEAKNERELISFCESLSCYQRSIEGRIGIITGSGGRGALVGGELASPNPPAPEIPQGDPKRNQGKKVSSGKGIASGSKPVELPSSAIYDDFAVTTQILSRTPEIDCILLLLLPYLPGTTSDLGARLSQIYRKEGKPLVAYVPHVEKYRMLIEGFELNNVPVSPSIEGAVQMAEAMRRCKPC